MDLGFVRAMLTRRLDFNPYEAFDWVWPIRRFRQPFAPHVGAFKLANRVLHALGKGTRNDPVPEFTQF